jgi:hypothetical protein
MDAYVLGQAQGAKYKDGGSFQAVASSRNPLFMEAVRVIMWWRTADKFPDFIIPVRPDYFDRRISLQRGCFTFHVPKRQALTEKENNTLTAYTIPGCREGADHQGPLDTRHRRLQYLRRFGAPFQPPKRGVRHSLTIHL